MIKYLIAIVVLILIGIMTSCGPYQVNVKHTHILEIDLSKLETYFRASCEEEQPDDVSGCTENKVGEFLNIVLSS
jgi:hypothetical protein